MKIKKITNRKRGDGHYKSKLGFTLIELLAVIVILAIIALIATPIVMNIIEDSKKGAAERGHDNYLKQINTKITSSYTSADKVKDGVYVIMENGNLCSKAITEGICPTGANEVTIEMSGTKPVSGTIIIDNGAVFDYSIYGTEYVSYKKDGKLATQKPTPEKCFYFEDGKVIPNPSSPCVLEGLIIPYKINGSVVTDIGSMDEVFLKYAVLPSGLVTIRSNAFMNNSYITNVVIPNSVTSIAAAAFAGNGLTSLVIPDSVETIGDYAFADNNLTSVKVINDRTEITIADHAFDGFDVNNIQWNS